MSPRPGPALAARLVATAPLLVAIALVGDGHAGATVAAAAKTIGNPAASPARPPAAVAAIYSEAAEQARRRDFDDAAKLLEPLLSSAPEAARARTVLGLLAWDAERCAPAHDWLGRGEAPAELEDWRLYALGDCASRTLGATAEARAAFTALAARPAPSPLAGRALGRLADLAWTERDAATALGWIDRARGERLAPGERTRLDALAWTIARESGDPVVEADAARRLLVEAPLEASRLEVAAALTARGVDWRSLLPETELLARAGALLEADVPEGALVTLEAVPPAARATAWRLLDARALTDLERGAEALAVLDRTTGAGQDERARIELARAAAADDAATVRAGRPHPPAEERARLKLLAATARARAADLAEAPELERRALTERYAELEAEDRFEEAIAVLARLVELDPATTLGARALWSRGWSEYRSANYTGAIGYWSELTALYPELSHARAARYWTARAHESLGETAVARRAYQELVEVDTRDFYAVQAALRLAAVPGGAPAAGSDLAAAAEPPREPWPVDPLLARAELLSELGLDALALLEIDELEALAAPRAVAALRARALSRHGEPRASLRELRKAFPRLGTARQESLPRSALELYYPRPFDDQVLRFARARKLPSSLVFGIVHQESGFDPEALSRSGARGLMQIMPSTARALARRLKVSYTSQRLFEPDYSLHLGTTYLSQLLGQFDHRVELALAGYNGGPGRIGRLWRAHGPERGFDLFLEELDLEESRNYVKRIVVLAESYRSRYSDLS